MGKPLSAVAEKARPRPKKGRGAPLDLGEAPKAITDPTPQTAVQEAPLESRTTDELLLLHHHQMDLGACEVIFRVLKTRTPFSALPNAVARDQVDRMGSKLDDEAREADFKARVRAMEVSREAEIRGVVDSIEPTAPTSPASPNSPTLGPDDSAEDVGEFGDMGEVGGVGAPEEALTAENFSGDEPTGEESEPAKMSADEDADEVDFDDEDDRAFSFDDTLDLIHEYCDARGIALRLDGTISGAAGTTKRTFAEIKAAAGDEPLNSDSLQQHVSVALHRMGKPTKYVRLALSVWMTQQRAGRRTALFNLTSVEQPDPGPGWDALRRMAELRFQGDPEYGAAMIEQIIWESKNKAWGDGVEDAHFYTFTSTQQWNGKTTLCKNIMSPLRENVRTIIGLESLVDNRWHGLWDSYGVIVDEIATKTAKDQNGLTRLKGIVTADEQNLRPSGLNRVDRKVNRVVLLGTSQSPCIDLFGDPSGMRRYVEVRMIEGFRYLDNAAVQAVTESIDWPAVWRGVDMLGASPIMVRDQRGVLDQLQAEMTPAQSLDSFDAWVEQFDADRSRAFQRDMDKQERVPIATLFEDYEVHSKRMRQRTILGAQGFENRMRAITANLSTKKGRTPDFVEPHHRFTKTDGRGTTMYQVVVQMAYDDED